MSGRTNDSISIGGRSSYSLLQYIIKSMVMVPVVQAAQKASREISRSNKFIWYNISNSWE